MVRPTAAPVPGSTLFVIGIPIFLAVLALIYLLNLEGPI